MKTAIFGGSFNPVHNGHLALAATVLDRTPYRRVLFVPAAAPPHKTLAAGASDEDRLAMLSIALGGLEGAEVWPGELRREGPSYTIDTVEQLLSEGLVEGRPGLVIGSDLVAGFGDWRRSGDLIAMTEVILAERDGTPAAPPFPCLRLENPEWPYSSTEVRDAIARGGDLASVVPPGVAAYIEEKGLYGYAK